MAVIQKKHVLSTQEHLDYLNQLGRKAVLYLLLSIACTILLLAATAGLSFGIFLLYGADVITHSILQALIIGKPLIDIIQGYTSNVGLSFLFSKVPLQWRADALREIGQYFSMHVITHKIANDKTVRIWSKAGLEAACIFDKMQTGDSTLLHAQYAQKIAQELRAIDIKASRIEEEIYYTERAYQAMKAEQAALSARHAKLTARNNPEKALDTKHKLKIVEEQLDRCTSLKESFKATKKDFKTALKPLQQSWATWISEADRLALKLSNHPERQKDGSLSKEQKNKIADKKDPIEREQKTKERILHLTNHIPIPHDPHMETSQLVKQLVHGRNKPFKQEFLVQDSPSSGNSTPSH